MGRKRFVEKREVLPDPKYRSNLIAKMVNTLMRDGKKSLAERILYGAFDKIQERGKDPLEVFKQAIENTKPVVEVKSRRVGGSNYQVPVEVHSSRRQALALRWLVSYSRDRAGKSMMEKLAAEIMDAANNTGGAVRKKEDVHKMAEANRAFAHYRW